MGIQINGQTDTITAIDGSLAIQGASGNITATGLSGTPDITVGSIIASSATISGNVSVAGTVTYEDVTNVDSIGVVTARSGVVIGTGASISSPSSNVLTLGTNNAERVRVSAAGSFGLGTNDPQVRLDVRQDSSSTTTMAGIRVQNTNITDNSQSGISFFNYDNFGAKIYSPRTGSAQGVLIFATNNGNGIAESNVVERARIDSSGNLGVGTNNPGYKLEVAGTASLGTSGLYGYKIQYIGPISNGSTFTLPSGRWQGELHYTWGNNSGRAAKRIVAFSKAPGASGDGYSSTWLDVNSGGSGVLAYSFNQSTGVFTWSVSDGSTSAGYAWILYHPGN